MTIKICLQLATKAKFLPSSYQFKKWTRLIFDNPETTFGKLNRLSEHKLNFMQINVRIVDEIEIADLNYRYRNKTGPTNVLSFSTINDIPNNLTKKITNYMLGDIVICANIIKKEAIKQNKILLSHWAHIFIHGTLHLLGYDHETLDQANEMEDLEIRLMNQLGFASPY
jgi:probable rRNA maturation factor